MAEEMNAHPLYLKSVERVARSEFLDFSAFRGKTFFVTGATGLIGKTFVDVLRFLNAREGFGAKIFALTRDAAAARERFADFGADSGEIVFVEQDARERVPEEISADYWICGASNTHPVAYGSDPLGTIEINIEGVKNLIAAARRSLRSRSVFLSSCEIYGENREGKNAFSEKDCGYIDCNTMRACYTEAKRLCECFFQIARAKAGLDFVTVRPSRIFGPTLLSSDSKASSQFLRNALAGENIVLKSAGTQLFSYTYTPDCVAGIFAALSKGESGEAYNVASEPMRLRDFAETCAGFAGTRVVFELPEGVEKAGYSVVQNSIFGTEKLRALGWREQWTLREAIAETLAILRG
ncbi:MAG: NAD-dependent epimerase/dehydratase family protein [Candidatus Spyradosoma sp.]